MFSESLRYFDVERFQKSGSVAGEVSKLTSKTKQQEWLKEQINVRVKGYGWREYKTAFSSTVDAEVGTVDNLTKALIKIIEEEKGRVPPVEPPVMETKCRKMPTLGTMSQQSKDFREQPAFTSEQLRTEHAMVAASKATKAAVRERERHDEFAHEQPTEAPEANESLVGRRVEVNTQIEEVVCDNEEVAEEDQVELAVYRKQWLPAVVTKMSGEGTDTKQSADGRALTVKMGWFLLNYDDGAVLWTRLRPETFNNNAAGSWRFDLDYEKCPGIKPTSNGIGVARKKGGLGVQDSGIWYGALRRPSLDKTAHGLEDAMRSCGHGHG